MLAVTALVLLKLRFAVDTVLGDRPRLKTADGDVLTAAFAGSEVPGFKLRKRVVDLFDQFLLTIAELLNGSLGNFECREIDRIAPALVHLVYRNTFELRQVLQDTLLFHQKEILELIEIFLFHFELARDIQRMKRQQ